MKHSRYACSRERGAALIVALIFLIALSLLGVSATTNNTLQERMAGNTRNRDIAFEAAEHALEKADTWIKANVANLEPLALSAGADRVFNHGENHANEAPYWLNTFDWTTAGLQKEPITGPKTDPLYLVEKMPDDPVTKKAYYRVTARGIGAAGNAVVILQAMYVINN